MANTERSLVKMSQIIAIFFVFAIVSVQMISAEGDCDKHFNAAQGVLTTNGFPNRLNFTLCQFHIDVGLGKIEVIFENVSLPDGAFIAFDLFSSASKNLNVDELRLESRFLYTKSHKASIFVILPRNVSDSYQGMRLFYRRVSKDTCIYKYKSVINTEKEVQSLGYPGSYAANSTCEYLVTASSKENVIQIGFRELSLGPGDVLTMYDATNKSVIFGPLSGLLESVETGRASRSSSVKIVVNASSSPAVRKYAFVFKELLRGTCVKDYYDGNLGAEQHIASAERSCLHTVRSKQDTWLRLWFESISISPGNFVLLTLKDYVGKMKMNWNLTSNDSTYVRNFDGVDQGNWFEIKQSSNVSFDLRFMSYSAEKCPYYKVSEEVKSGLLSPNYPGNFSPNSRCEFYFKAKDNTKVVNVLFTELVLNPADDVTVYDPTNGGVIAKYNGTENLLGSVTSKGDSARIVFTFADNRTTVGRRFSLVHKALSKSPDKCLVEYVALDKSGQFSSVNRSCEYNLYYSFAKAELTFENIHVPHDGSITVIQARDSYHRAIGNIRSEDSGKTKYFGTLDRFNFNMIIVRTNTTNVLFRMSFKPFISSRTVILQGSNGTLLSPYYPESYLRDIEQVFYVTVPRGHVMLNFTEIKLFGRSYSTDQLTIYDGHTTSQNARLDYFQGRSPINVPQWFLSSSNNITVKFFSNNDVVSGTYRFKALYSMNTQVNFCGDLKWPNAHPERNLTLPGRTTKYFCNKDYFNPDHNNINVGKWISRKCSFDGEWEQGATLTCKRICPKLDEKLKGNSTLRWDYSARFYHTDKPFEGTHVRFQCKDYYHWELNGPETIRCTSHGNYSAAPPTCKKRPKKDKDSSSSSDAWKYGAGVGGTLFIVSIVIAVLRVCFGCFTCCDTAKASSDIPMSGLSTEKLT